MPEKERISIMWFRRDIRLDDNTALYHALHKKEPVLPLFIFDTTIIQNLEKDEHRINFIYNNLKKISNDLRKEGSGLIVRKGTPLQVFKELADEFQIEHIYCNEDYESYAVERDHIIKGFAESKCIQFHAYKDQVIFDKKEISKKDGTPYTVYTPYTKKWREKLVQNSIKPLNIKELRGHFYKKDHVFPSLESLGYRTTTFVFPEIEWDKLKNYKETRDFLGLNATSKISIHLRFGTISIREVVLRALKESDAFLGELIWREFFMMILHHFPRVQSESFKKKYNLIEWDNNEYMFIRWCEGRTGYPLVDAGMRELNSTGYMHNRVRMVVACFLCKHLLIDWRWGEQYFAEKLLDYELSSNNGNWQWAAGTGCDAAPYFRIFNPNLQAKKFDKENLYIRKWVSEFSSKEYASPIVVHEAAIKRCIERYRKAIF